MTQPCQTSQHKSKSDGNAVKQRVERRLGKLMRGFHGGGGFNPGRHVPTTRMWSI